MCKQKRHRRVLALRVASDKCVGLGRNPHFGLMNKLGRSEMRYGLAYAYFYFTSPRHGANKVSSQNSFAAPDIDGVFELAL